MISKIFHDNQSLISDYKEVIGPLSGNVFPFKQSYIDYLSYEKPDFSLSGLRLVNNMKFNYGFYLWSNNESQKDGVRVSVDGHYEVDLNKELLTLNIEKVTLWEPIGKFKGSQDVNKINQIFSENLKKFEVKNYNWFTRVILIRRPNIIPEGDLLNFAMYTQEDVELKLDNGISPNPQIVIIQNQIERLRKGPVINLPETYIYEVKEDKERISLSLHPNGSLSFIHTNSHWDRDGCYGSWDSELKATGQWIYDYGNKTITLKFANFILDEDKKIVDFYSKCGVPADVVTSPFTFEMDKIQCIYASWMDEKLVKLEEMTYTLKRKNE